MARVLSQVHRSPLFEKRESDLPSRSQWIEAIHRAGRYSRRRADYIFNSDVFAEIHFLFTSIITIRCQDGHLVRRIIMRKNSHRFPIPVLAVTRTWKLSSSGSMTDTELRVIIGSLCAAASSFLFARRGGKKNFIISVSFVMELVSNNVFIFGSITI